MKLLELLEKSDLNLDIKYNPELRYEYAKYKTEGDKIIFHEEYGLWTAELTLTPNDSEVLLVELAILDDNEFTGWKLYQNGNESLLN